MAAAGRVAPELAAELPGLSLRVERVEAGEAVTGRSPAELRSRLRELSDRFRGSEAIELRRRDVPHAYRVLFRHLGIDPDEHRTPIEAAVLDRLLHGGFRSGTLLEDALLVALVETGVGVWAVEGVRGELSLRFDGSGRVVVADADGVVAPVFAAPRPVGKGARAVVLYAVGAPGVPEMVVDEALWIAGSALGA